MFSGQTAEERKVLLGIIKKNKKNSFKNPFLNEFVAFSKKDKNAVLLNQFKSLQSKSDLESKKKEYSSVKKERKERKEEENKSRSTFYKTKNDYDKEKWICMKDFQTVFRKDYLI